MWLSDDDFKAVIGNTPLISIDLIVRNANAEVLLGERQNRPAQGFWFVPGGRVRKNETLDDAFLRLTEEELGLVIARQDAKWLGVYQHFYTDSVFGEGDDAPSTHYIVLAYEIDQLSQMEMTQNQQHHAFQWWNEEKLLNSQDVHRYTKDYFRA